MAMVFHGCRWAVGTTAVCAPFVCMLGEGGGLCSVSCTVEVRGSASQLCVGGSFDDVVVGVVVVWIAGGVTPGGGGNMGIVEVFVTWVW